MRVFVYGITGGVGRLISRKLIDRGDRVAGLVRRESQRAELEADGIETVIGDLSQLTPEALASMLNGVDAIVFTAGSNAVNREVTTEIDGKGLSKTVEAAQLAGVDRFVSVSVLPEALRGSGPTDDLEYYFAVKKIADVALAASPLNWVILRPSRLTDNPGAGVVALSPAQLHGEISRDDVATTVVELLHEGRIRRRVLELDEGSTPILEAVQNNVG